ncbi:MAG: hypothetical protein JNL24_09265 [Bacteroidia bacterium]|nr:hypothetical protein [Bacteroidia bacterium]
MSGRKKVLYEWHFAMNQIHAIDEGEPYKIWNAQFKTNGYKLTSTKLIEFEGFVLKRMVFSSENNSIGGIDPLAMVTGGYLKADTEWVVFEVDFAESVIAATPSVV